MEWKRFESQIESLPERRRARAKRLAEFLVARERMKPDEAVMEAMRRYGPTTRQDAPKSPRALASAEISLATPHGPEGESHGGRAGRDPLRFVEDSTPQGTNAYSEARGSPAESARRVGKGTARAARRIPPARRKVKPEVRVEGGRGKGAVKRLPRRVRQRPRRAPVRAKQKLPRSPDA